MSRTARHRFALLSHGVYDMIPPKRDEPRYCYSVSFETFSTNPSGARPRERSARTLQGFLWWEAEHVLPKGCTFRVAFDLRGMKLSFPDKKPALRRFVMAGERKRTKLIRLIRISLGASGMFPPSPKAGRMCWSGTNDDEMNEREKSNHRSERVHGIMGTFFEPVFGHRNSKADRTASP